MFESKEDCKSFYVEITPTHIRRLREATGWGYTVCKGQYRGISKTQDEGTY